MASPTDTVHAALSARGLATERADLFLARLRALVGIDTGVDNPRGRDEAAGLLGDWCREAGCDVKLVPHEAGLHLIARLFGQGGPRIVLLGHHDTVFPVGSAAERPLRTEDGRAFGPGVADMKGGLLVGLAAIEALARGERAFGSVELHSVPDEEIRTSPFATIDAVAGADAVLVLECGRGNGDLVAGRKTGAWVRLSVRGRSAHAGTEPERGRSAVAGLCHEVIRCEEIDGARPGLTVMAGTITGGLIANVVPERASAMLDVRATSAADFEWALAEIARVGEYEGLTVGTETAGVWPGIEPGSRNGSLLGEALRLGEALGVDLGFQTSGGMSDGCWTADLGVPTLDGLGPVGAYDHSPGEYIELRSVPQRTGIIVGLCEAVGRGLVGPLLDHEGVTS